MFLHIAARLEAVPLGLPRGGHLGRLLLEFGKVLFQLFKPVLRRLVVFLLQRFAFDLHLQDLPVERVQLLGLRVHFHPQPRRGLVDKVDRLVRQESVGDVTVRKLGGCYKGSIRDVHAVVHLILLLDAAQDRNRILYCRLGHHQRLEPPGKGRVLLDMLSVLVQRRRPNAVKFPPCQRGLEQVRRVHRAFGLPTAHKRVHFVDEQDDFSGCRSDLRQHGLQPLLELAPVFRAGNQRAHVERHQLLVPQGFGHVAIDDPHCEPLGNRRLTHTGLTDQDGVVLRAPRQNLHRPAYLFVAADDRVDLAVPRGFGQIAGVPLKRIVAFFSRSGIGRPAFAHVIDRRVQPLGRNSTRFQRILGL